MFANDTTLLLTEWGMVSIVTQFQMKRRIKSFSRNNWPTFVD